jgi:hypothetical protein
VSAILGALAGLAIGYVTVRLYQWWEWRNVPHEAYYAPMSTTPPTVAIRHPRSTCDWCAANGELCPAHAKEADA